MAQLRVDGIRIAPQLDVVTLAWNGFAHLGFRAQLIRLEIDDRPARARAVQQIDDAAIIRQRVGYLMIALGGGDLGEERMPLEVTEQAPRLANRRLDFDRIRQPGLQRERPQEDVEVIFVGKAPAPQRLVDKRADHPRRPTGTFRARDDSPDPGLRIADSRWLIADGRWWMAGLNRGDR